MKDLKSQNANRVPLTDEYAAFIARIEKLENPTNTELPCSEISFSNEQNTIDLRQAALKTAHDRLKAKCLQMEKAMIKKLRTRAPKSQYEMQEKRLQENLLARKDVTIN